MTNNVDVANLFDIWNPGSELLRDPRDGLLDQRLVLYRLMKLHDAIPVVSGSQQGVTQHLQGAYRIIVPWI